MAASLGADSFEKVKLQLQDEGFCSGVWEQLAEVLTRLHQAWLDAQALDALPLTTFSQVCPPILPLTSFCHICSGARSFAARGASLRALQDSRERA